MITIGIYNDNNGHFLDECLQSVIQQNYPNKEIIIVDDRSTDGSIDKIKAYQQIDPSLRVIFHQQHTGNKDLANQEIIRESGGEFAMLLSSSDFLPHGGVLDDLMRCFNEHQEIEYVYGNFTLVNMYGKQIGQWNYRDYSADKAALSIYSRQGSGVIPMIGLYKLSFYRKHQTSWVIDPDNIVAGEVLNCLINLKRGWKIHHLNKPVLCYRRHESSKSHDLGTRVKSVISVLEYIIKDYHERIYLTSVNWALHKGDERASLKAYVIGQTYESMAKSYYHDKSIRHYDREAKINIVQPLIVKMRQYFDESLASGNAHEQDIRNKIDEMNQLLSRKLPVNQKRLYRP
jgi:glycosyltransferase involved in cell wall biosynthesis